MRDASTRDEEDALHLAVLPAKRAALLGAAARPAHRRRHPAATAGAHRPRGVAPLRAARRRRTPDGHANAPDGGPSGAFGSTRRVAGWCRISTSPASLKRVPRAARRAVAAGDVAEAPRDLGGGVGLPVGAGRSPSCCRGGPAGCRRRRSGWRRRRSSPTRGSRARRGSRTGRRPTRRAASMSRAMACAALGFAGAPGRDDGGRRRTRHRPPRPRRPRRRPGRGGGRCGGCGLLGGDAVGLGDGAAHRLACTFVVSTSAKTRSGARSL